MLWLKTTPLGNQKTLDVKHGCFSPCGRRAGGETGNSGSMLPARRTIPACKPECALQVRGGRSWLSSSGVSRHVMTVSRKPALSPLGRSDRGVLAASERWLRGWCRVREKGVERWQELRYERWASLFRRGEGRAGWFLGSSEAGHSICSRKGLARSPRIRAGSSQGAAQEFRMKAMAPRTPSS
jgi:hypothetical protein